MHCTVSINQSTSLMQSNMAERSSDQSLRARQQTSRDGGQVFRYGGSDLRGKDHVISTQEWKGKKKVGDEPRPRLPAHLVSLRRKSFTVYVSNLSLRISKTELEAMFFRSGRIVDSFLPVDRVSGLKRGFAFVRFRSTEEADRAVVEGYGRSWGGKENPSQLGQT